MQFIEHVDKDDAGNVSSQKVMGVRVRSIQNRSSYSELTIAGSQYVPLTDQHKQLGSSCES